MSFLLVGKLVAQTQTPEQAPVTQLIAGFESPVDDLVGSPWKLESYGKGAVDLQFQETDQAIGKAASVHCDGSAGPKGLLMHGLSKPTDWTRFVEFSVNVMRQGTGEPNRLFLQFWSVNEQGKRVNETVMLAPNLLKTLKKTGQWVTLSAKRSAWSRTNFKKIIIVKFIFDGIDSDENMHLFFDQFTGTLDPNYKEPQKVSHLLKPGSIDSLVNLPDAFYQRSGLENMPRLDYRSMTIVNVRDCGAKGDGKADDTQAFVEALGQLTDADVSENGGIVYIPEGVYRFVQPRGTRNFWVVGLRDSKINKLRNIHFVGQGEGSIIQFDSDLNNVPFGWVFAAADNVSLRDMSFRYFPTFDVRGGLGRSGYNVQFGGYPSVNPRDVKNIQMLRVHFDQGVIGPWVQSVKNVWVVGCQVRNTTADGIHFEAVQHSTAAYNFVENTGDDLMACISTSHPKYHVEISNDNRFIHNTLIDSRQARGVAMGGVANQLVDNWIERASMPSIMFNIHGHNGAGNPIIDALVADNKIYYGSLTERDDSPTSHRYGGMIKMETHLKNVRIENNLLFGGECNGIYLNVGAMRAGQTLESRTNHNLQIIGNTITNQTGSAIVLEKDMPVDGVTIEGNRFFDNGATSVVFASPVKNFKLRDNIVDAMPRVTQAGLDTKAIMAGFEQTANPSPRSDPYRAMRYAPSEKNWNLVGDVKPATQNILDIKALGAIGDGVHDDREAIEKALTQLSETGGTLRIPAGVYRITVPEKQPLDFTKVSHHLMLRDAQSVCIEGEGANSVLIFDSPDAHGLRLFGCKRVVLRNVTFKLAKQPPLRRNRALVLVSHSSEMVVEKVTADHSAGQGIRVDSSTGVRLENLTVNDCGTMGIDLVASRQVEVTGCHINRATDAGIFLGYNGSIHRMPEYLKIHNNTVTQTKQGFGIALTTGKEVLVEKNQITGTYQAGLVLYQFSLWYPPLSLTLKDNQLSQCNTGASAWTNAPIHLSDLKGGDIKLTDNNVTGGNGKGIWIDRNRLGRLTVQNNTFASDISQPVIISEKQRKMIKQLIMD
ncbi:MAG: hypothetical protein CMJ19_00745 [Phycisphaeraceae bacterium]|nr:hypothetical protein [Phycisphaeraceae bacterium]